MAFIEMITQMIPTVLGWLGTFFDSLLTTEGDLNSLLPLMVISVIVSVVLLGIKLFRGSSWGA